MNTLEYEKLRNLDYSKELFIISDYMRRTGRLETVSIVAVAYVLYITGTTPNINIYSMDEFFISAKISGNRRLFLEGLLQNRWKIIQKLAFTIEPDILKAIILFTDSISNMVEYESSSTPAGVCQLAARLLDIHKGESVIDLGSGIGNFLRESAFIQPDASYNGLEINTYLCEMSVIRSEILDENITIMQGDIFSVNDKTHYCYDKVFSHYPWAMRYRGFYSESSNTIQEIYDSFPELRKAYSSDWSFNAVLVSLMKDGGKAIGIMSCRSLFTNMDREIRQSFVSKGLIEKVILLPKDLFLPYTKVPSLMIVFSQNNQSIRMIDASNFGLINRRGATILTKENIDTILKCCETDTEDSKSVSISELKKNNYELIPLAYLDSQVTVSNGIAFKELIKTINRGAQLTSSDLDSILSNKPTDTEYLMLKNIDGGVIDRNLPYIQPNDKYEKFLLKSNTLIISKNTNPTKICVVDISPERKIIASGNLYIVELDETKANPYYVKAFLDSPTGRKSIEKASTGSVIRIISMEKLQKIMIPMIPIDEQNRFGIEYQAAMDEIQVLKLKTEKAVDRLEHLFDTFMDGADENA